MLKSVQLTPELVGPAAVFPEQRTNYLVKSIESIQQTNENANMMIPLWLVRLCEELQRLWKDFSTSIPA